MSNTLKQRKYYAITTKHGKRIPAQRTAPDGFIDIPVHYFYNHLCSVERHLRMSHKLGADVVYLNQAEVETLTTNFSTFKS